jgi:hypothetical protein
MLRRVVPSMVVPSGARVAASLVSSMCLRSMPPPTATNTSCQYRLASSGGIEVRSAADQDHDNALGDHHAEADEDEGEVLDLVEASLQECHDLSIALHENLQRLGAHRGRVPHVDASRNYYETRQDASKGMELYHAHIEKLLFHIAQPQVVPRMMHSAGRIKHNARERAPKAGERGVAYRRDQPHRALPSMQMDFTCYPQMFRHAPFEATSVRSDMPSHIGVNARSLRDNDTILNLAKIIKMRHPRGMELMSTWLQLVEKAPAVTYETSSIMSDDGDN